MRVEVLVTRTLTEKARGHDSHWSTRSMAAETGLSQSSVSRIWRAFGLKPHVVETWKLRTDPEFIGKVRGQPPRVAADHRKHRQPRRPPHLPEPDRHRDRREPEIALRHLAGIVGGPAGGSGGT
jgi:hypothetical protein